MTLVMYAADLMSRIIRNYSRYLDPLSRRSYSLVLLGAAFLLLAQSSLDATTLPSGFAETKVAGLHDGTCMAITPDGRVLVTTQEGQVRVVKDGVLLTTPFVTVVTDTYQERGLNGIAVDPDFATNQYIYIYYTATTPTVHNRVSRFTANGDVATSGSETVILDLDDLRTDGLPVRIAQCHRGRRKNQKDAA